LPRKRERRLNRNRRNFLCESLLDSHISLEEIHESGMEICVSLSKTHESLGDSHKSLPDLCELLEELPNSGSKSPDSSGELGNFFFPTTQGKRGFG